MRRIVLSLAMLAAALPAGAQPEIRRAQITGGGGRGNCSIAVDVDAVAEVHVRGDEARLVTISGAPARWLRFVCNQPMPLDPVGFRYRGVDGRGRQELISEPGGRRPAVIRIEDPKGGSEGYTFALEWTGSSGSGWGGADPGWDSGRAGSKGAGGGWGPPTNRGRGQGLNREMNLRGRGEGYFRNSRGANDRLYDCEVNVGSNGDIQVRFRTDRRPDFELRGRVERVEGDRIYASVSVGGAAGSITIVMDRERVRSVAMEPSGRDRAEIRWRD